MFPPFFNATSTARVLSLLLHFLKQNFFRAPLSKHCLSAKSGKPFRRRESCKEGFGKGESL